MRLFGVSRLTGVLNFLGLEDGEAIEHPRVSKAIEGAQKRVETENFSIRKRLLDFDDVMNVQREVIYSRRREYIESDDISEEVQEKILEVVEALINRYTDPVEDPQGWDLPGLQSECERIFLAPLQVAEKDIPALTQDDLADIIVKIANAVYKQKEEVLGSETMRQVERMAFLSTITEMWKDHLYEMDQLRTGIGMRSYAQRDPLVEYKKEAYRMFAELLEDIDKQAVRFCFLMQPADQGEISRRRKEELAAQKAQHKKKESLGFRAPQGAVQAEGKQVEDDTPEQGKPKPFKRRGKKIGRNDPCPCGSGKKYKKCCGRNV